MTITFVWHQGSLSFVKCNIIERLRKVTRAVHLKLVSKNQSHFRATPVGYYSVSLGGAWEPSFNSLFRGF